VPARTRATAAADDDDEKERAAIEDLKWKRIKDVKGVAKAEDPDAKTTKELEIARAQVKELTRQLDTATRRLAELETRQAGHATTVVVTQDGFTKLVQIDPKTGKIVQERIVAGKMPTENSNTTARIAPYDDAIANYNKAKSSAARPPSSSYGSSFDRGGGGLSREQRLDALESNLKALLDEVRALKKESDRKPESTRNDPRKAM
jgi:hypothetical protein